VLEARQEILAASIGQAVAPVQALVARVVEGAQCL